MDLLYKIWAFLGFLAFIQIGILSDRIHRKERSENGNLYAERSSVKDDMTQILASYIGKEVILDFYEDEEDWDLADTKATLLDMDSKWALLQIEAKKEDKKNWASLQIDSKKEHMQKLIRISSIKGITV